MRKTIAPIAGLVPIVFLSGCSQVLQAPHDHPEALRQIFEGAINGGVLWGFPLIAAAYGVLLALALVRIPFLARRKRTLFRAYVSERRVSELIWSVAIAAVPFGVGVIEGWLVEGSVLYAIRLTERTMAGSIHAVASVVETGIRSPLKFYVAGFVLGLVLPMFYIVRTLVTDAFETWVTDLTQREIRELGEKYGEERIRNGRKPPDETTTTDPEPQPDNESEERREKSEKARRREEQYAREMAKIDRTTSQTQLRSIVLNTQRRQAVRKKALEKITDRSILGEIYAETAPTDEIRKIIQKLWPEVVDQNRIANDPAPPTDQQLPAGSDGPIAFKEATSILIFPPEHKANFEARKHYDTVVTKKHMEPYKEVFFLYRENPSGSHPYLVVHTGSYAPMAAATFGTDHSRTVFRACFPDKDPESEWSHVTGESVVTDYAPEGYEITDYTEINALREEIRRGYYRVERPQATPYWDRDIDDSIETPAPHDEPMLEVRCNECFETFTTPNREGGSLQCPHCHAAPTDESRHAYPAELVKPMWGADFAIVDCPCPECGKLNRAVFVPPDKVWANRYGQTVDDEDGAYRIRRKCHYCGKDFNVAFD